MTDPDDVRAEATATAKAKAMNSSALAARLRMYADDLASEGRLHAPAVLREAADRLLAEVDG